VLVHTAVGIGTSFELVLPASLASMDALMVEASGAGATAIPLDAVRSTVRVTAGAISRASPGASVLHGETSSAFLPLPAALDGTRCPVDRDWTTVILEAAAGTAAIGVDRLLGTAHIVVRPLPERLPASPVVAGASLDTEGNPRLILDPEGLVAAAQ